MFPVLAALRPGGSEIAFNSAGTPVGPQKLPRAQPGSGSAESNQAGWVERGSKGLAGLWPDPAIRPSQRTNRSRSSDAAPAFTLKPSPKGLLHPNARRSASCDRHLALNTLEQMAGTQIGVEGADQLEGLEKPLNGPSLELPFLIGQLIQSSSGRNGCVWPGSAPPVADPGSCSQAVGIGVEAPPIEKGIPGRIVLAPSWMLSCAGGAAAGDPAGCANGSRITLVPMYRKLPGAYQVENARSWRQVPHSQLDRAGRFFAGDVRVTHAFSTPLTFVDNPVDDPLPAQGRKGSLDAVGVHAVFAGHADNAADRIGIVRCRTHHPNACATAGSKPANACQIS